MDAKLMTALCFFFTASPVLADEVLYCVDTAVTGFKWNQSGQASVAQFKPTRFTIKIVSLSDTDSRVAKLYGLRGNTKRIVTEMEGDTAGRTRTITCGPPRFDESVACDEVVGGRPWIFSRSTYTRAFLAGGPPAGGRDPNIAIAYGTCTNRLFSSISPTRRSRRGA
jgi:hypothetical protein